MHYPVHPKTREPRWAFTAAIGLGVAALLLTQPLPASAVEYIQGDWRTNLNVVATIGTAIKTSTRDADLLDPGDARVLGIKGRALGGGNAVAGDANYGAGDFESSVVKSFASLDVSNTAGYGVFVSGYGWYDYSQANSNVALGNTPQGYTPDKPLSDRGFDTDARFGGAVLEQAYLHGKTTALGGNLSVQLGQQIIGWGSSLTIPGGVREIDPRNFAAQSRPGFQRDEGYVPFPAIEAAWDVTPNVRIEGFYELQQAHSVLPGCGTYAAINSYAPDGCNLVTAVPTFSNQQSLLANLVFNRSPDRHGSDLGTFGLGGSYTMRSIGTRVSLYLAQYSERLPEVNSIKGRGLGFTSSSGGVYQVAYPDGTKVASLISNSILPPLGIKLAAEFDQMVDQPFAYNATDTLVAGILGTGPLGARLVAAAPGTVLRNYDRHATSQIGLGGEKTWKGVAGADEAVLGVEAGGKFVEGLPPISQRRYGRADLFGSGNGPGIVCVNQLACSKAGYVTSVSWGYRMRGSLVYRNVGIQGINVTPSITFFQDVNGTSSDGAFVEGRITLRAQIDADFGSRYFTNISWTTQTGGNYNIRTDRDVALVSVGVRL